VRFSWRRVTSWRRVWREPNPGARREQGTR
jgi:hypothetical protein